MPFSITISSTSPVFTQKNTFKKITIGEIRFEQIIEFEWRGPWPPGLTCTPITVYFHDKTKISNKNL